MENKKQQSSDKSMDRDTQQTQGVPTPGTQQPQGTSANAGSTGKQQQPKEWDEDTQSSQTGRAPQTGSPARQSDELQERDEQQSRK